MVCNRQRRKFSDCMKNKNTNYKKTSSDLCNMALVGSNVVAFESCIKRFTQVHSTDITPHYMYR